MSWSLKTVGLIGLLWLFAGVASSLLGIGAGVALVPVLSLTWDKMHDSPQKLAQGTALALMVPMALAGAFRAMDRDVRCLGACRVGDGSYDGAGGHSRSGMAGRSPGKRTAYSHVAVDLRSAGDHHWRPNVGVAYVHHRSIHAWRGRVDTGATHLALIRRIVVSYST